MERTENSAFGMKDKIGYMFGDFGNDFTFLFASVFLMVFYTKVLGISAGMVGTLFLVAQMCGCLYRHYHGKDCRQREAFQRRQISSVDFKNVRSGSSCQFFDVSRRNEGCSARTENLCTCL